MESFAEICAGLGLFFIGINALGNTLRQSDSQWLNVHIKKFANRKIFGGSLGLFLGLATQSSSAVTFIIINMLTAGLMTLRTSIPMLVLANIGTSFLVFVAVFDISLVVFFLLGLVGAFYYMKWDRIAGVRSCLDIVFGICMLLLGLHFMETATGTVGHTSLVKEFLEFSADSILLSFLIGVVLTLILQSSAAVTLLVATFTAANLFSWEQGVLIVMGSSLGSGLNIYLLASNSRGYAKQLTTVQLLIKLIGVLALMSVFVFDHVTGSSYLYSTLQGISAQSEVQFAVIYLAMQLAGGLAILLLSSHLARLVELTTPPLIEEQFSEPKYISSYINEEVQPAVELAFSEQKHLIDQLTQCLVRAKQGEVNTEEVVGLYTACENIHRQTEQFLRDTSAKCRDRSQVHKLINVRYCNEIYGAILHCLQDYLVVLLSRDLRQGDLEPAAFTLNTMTDELIDYLANLSKAVSHRFKQADKELLLSLSARPKNSKMLFNDIDHLDGPINAHIFNIVSSYNQARHAIYRYVSAVHAV